MSVELNNFWWCRKIIWNPHTQGCSLICSVSVMGQRLRLSAQLSHPCLWETCSLTDRVEVKCESWKKINSEMPRVTAETGIKCWWSWERSLESRRDQGTRPPLLSLDRNYRKQGPLAKGLIEPLLGQGPRWFSSSNEGISSCHRLCSFSLQAAKDPIWEGGRLSKRMDSLQR